jgi:hypothetical protein
MSDSPTYKQQKTVKQTVKQEEVPNTLLSLQKVLLQYCISFLGKVHYQFVGSICKQINTAHLSFITTHPGHRMIQDATSKRIKWGMAFFKRVRQPGVRQPGVHSRTSTHFASPKNKRNGLEYELKVK